MESLNYLYTEKSYWVFIDYKRPFNSNIRQAKKDMILALRKFLDTKVTCFPWDVSANPEITLSIYESNSGNSKLFSPGGNDDLDAGGWVIPIYVQNIRYCIDRKSSKISKCLNEYSEWWLYLIDNMRFLSDKEEISEIVNLVGNTGSFDKICLLSYDGKNILATFSKQ